MECVLVFVGVLDIPDEATGVQPCELRAGIGLQDVPHAGVAEAVIATYPGHQAVQRAKAAALHKLRLRHLRSS